MKKYDLETSLALYEELLSTQLQDKEFHDKFISEFSSQQEIGCFCPPTQKCHTDIIIKYCNKLNMKSIPKRQCVKTKFLRPQYDNLKEWIEVKGHLLCTRNGRIWIHNPETKEKTIYHYPCSQWANPYKVDMKLKTQPPQNPQNPQK